MNNAIYEQKTKERTSLEEVIFEVLQEAGTEVTMVDLLNRVGDRGLNDEGVVKAAIVHLLAQGKLAMTSHRLIHLP
jgi:hypothetical protein